MTSTKENGRQLRIATTYIYTVIWIDLQISCRNLVVHFEDNKIDSRCVYNKKSRTPKIIWNELSKSCVVDHRVHRLRKATGPNTYRNIENGYILNMFAIWKDPHTRDYISYSSTYTQCSQLQLY